MSSDRTRRQSRLTATMLFGIVAGMIGLSYASVPLYRMFCQATGFAGTPKTEGVVVPSQPGDGFVTVRFDANVNSELPWQFHPAQRQLRVRLGEQTLAHYVAANRSDRPVTGTATFNVSPDKAAMYFSKIDCFCFTEQTLAPGQEVSMPVSFFVDPALAEDTTVNDVTNITLSYTFYRATDDGEPQGKTAKIVAVPASQVGG